MECPHATTTRSKRQPWRPLDGTRSLSRLIRESAPPKAQARLHRGEQRENLQVSIELLI